MYAYVCVSELSSSDVGRHEEEGTYEPKRSDHKVSPAGYPDVQQRAHVRRRDARGDDDVVDLAVRRNRLLQRGRTTGLLRLDGALFELGRDKVDLVL